MNARIIAKPALFAEVADGGHVVIEAAAGTGKTFTIEHLVVDLILGGATIDSILVVTFTVRATHELRIRVRKTIERLLDAAGEDVASGPSWVIDDAARQLLRAALAQFDTAAIFTIHGFCQRVLIEHAFVCGRPLEQTVVDGRVAFSRAFFDALRTKIACDHDMAQLLGHWLDHRSVSALEDVLFRYHGQHGEIAPKIAPERLDAMLACAQGLARMARDPQERGEVVDGYQRVLPSRDRNDGLEVLAAVMRVLQRFDAADWGAMVAALDDVELRLLWAPGFRAPHERDKPLLLDRLPPAAAAFGRELFALSQLMFPLDAAALQWFLPPVQEALNARKAREGWLDHDDMLSAVLGALRAAHGPAVVRSLRQRYHFALIDEFQDTDALQWEIFRRIFVDRAPADLEDPEWPELADGADDTVAAALPRMHRLFVIGDPKQAIYSFRGGDVATYLDARQTLATSCAPLHLRENFRSTPEMVDAVNLLFLQQASEPLFSGPIRYDEPVIAARQSLRLCAAAPEGDDGTAPSAAVLPLAILQVRGSNLRAAALRKRIGTSIAQEVARLLSDDAALWLEDRVDPAHSGAHDGAIDATGDLVRERVRARDIFVLTRSNPEAAEMAQHLRRVGVRYAFFKRDGLFQTSEAFHVRDVLAAVAHPHREASRLRAWHTPFFGVSLHELDTCRDLPDTHALVRQLLDWHELATSQRFDRLFPTILSESGLVRRELFVSDSERALTNYLHIFEVLLDDAGRLRGTLDALLSRLSSYIDGTRQPPGVDGNVQRLESEREAVQIMTVHKAKGLEAAVVFVYGGFTHPAPRPPFIYHLPAHAESEEPDGPEWPDEVVPKARRIIGLKLPTEPAALQAFEQEEREENERLLYVACTRSKGRLYLPYYVHHDINAYGRAYFVGSSYAPMRDRLQSLLSGSDPASRDACDLLEVLDVDDDGMVKGREPVPVAQDAVPLADTSLTPTLPGMADGEGVRAPRPEWTLPLLTFKEARWTPPEELSGRRLVVTSYSRMKAAEHTNNTSWETGQQREDVVLAEDALPGGAASGSFLHDVLERVPFGLVGEARAHDDAGAWWREQAPVATVFDDAMARHGIADRYRRSAEALVFAALAAPVKVGSVVLPDGIAGCPAHLPEMEFTFPIPEAAHPSIAKGLPAEALTIERGWVKGFIDLLFEHDGRLYFVDWKSDLLPSYAPEALATHVAEHYQWQARLYTLAVAKMLGIGNGKAHTERFGGLLYFFVRGMRLDNPPGVGVYTERPTWRDVLAFERMLRAHERFA